MLNPNPGNCNSYPNSYPTRNPYRNSYSDPDPDRPGSSFRVSPDRAEELTLELLDDYIAQGVQGTQVDGQKVRCTLSYVIVRDCTGLYWSIG